MTGKVRVAIAGVGSCASSFAQTVAAAAQSDRPMPGIMHAAIGGYHLRDVEFVTAFDVDQRKVGLDLAKAIRQAPTVAQMHAHVPPTGVLVEAGPLLDGIDGHLTDVVAPHPDSAVRDVEWVTSRLAARADVLVCLLPTGATKAVRAYARAAAAAGVSFVNATPEPVANDPEFVRLFEVAGAVLLGDDLRSHFGATTLHTALVELLQSRALEVVNTYQLNIGGNADFLNLSNPARSRSKQRSKRRALTAAGIDTTDVSAGPNGYVKYLGDTKTCYLRIEAASVLDTTAFLEIRLEVEDSPNAAGVLANAVRVSHVAKDRGAVGVVDDVCAFLFKSPRLGATESAGLRAFEGFVAGVDGSG